MLYQLSYAREASSVAISRARTFSNEGVSAAFPGFTQVSLWRQERPRCWGLQVRREAGVLDGDVCAFGDPLPDFISAACVLECLGVDPQEGVGLVA